MRSSQESQTKLFPEASASTRDICGTQFQLCMFSGRRKGRREEIAAEICSWSWVWRLMFAILEFGRIWEEGWGHCGLHSVNLSGKQARKLSMNLGCSLNKNLLVCKMRVPPSQRGFFFLTFSPRALETSFHTS